MMDELPGNETTEVHSVNFKYKPSNNNEKMS